MCNLADVTGWPQTHTGTGSMLPNTHPNEDFNWSLLCTDVISDNSCVTYFASITYLCHMWLITRGMIEKKKKK